VSDLILFAPEVPPCVRSVASPEWTMCGRLVGNAPTITEAQAIVYLRNDRCKQCRPNHQSSRTNQTARRAMR